MTPLGWARANLIYDKMTHAPEPGSPLESLMIFVWLMRREAEYYRARVVTQAIVDSKGNSPLDAWKDYRNAEFPYLEAQQKKADKAAMAYFDREAARGPLTVVPLQGLGRKKRRKGRRNGTDQRRAQQAKHQRDMPDVRVSKIGEYAKRQRELSRLRVERYKGRSDKR